MVTNHWGAIQIESGKDCVVKNNTVVSQWEFSAPLLDNPSKPHIKFMRAKTDGCEAFNNISGGVTYGEGALEAGVDFHDNLDYDLDFSSARFTAWEWDTDPRLFDLTLTSGSPAVDTGERNGAPLTDFVELCRPYGEIIDIGAYEYDDGGSCGFPALAFTSFSIDGSSEAE